jgi:hypothetical protein
MESILPKYDDLERVAQEAAVKIFMEYMKKCGKCGEVKLLTEFNKDASKKDGLRGWCKMCWRKKRRDVHNKSESQKESIAKYLRRQAKRPLIKDDKRLGRVQRKVRAHFKKKYKERDKERNKAKANEDRLQGIRDRLQGIRDKVKEFGYDILSEFSSQKDRAIVRCESGHERETQLSYILIGRGGCRECRIDEGQRRIELSAKKLGAKILSKYESKHKKVLYRCSNGHETMRYPSSIWDGHHCGECENGSNNYSFYHDDEDKQNRDGYFYEFYFNKEGRVYKMIGIATVWKARLSQYRTAGIKPFDISLTKIKMYDAFVCEQEILHRKELQDLKSSGLGFSGSTECFDVTDIDLFHPVHSV